MHSNLYNESITIKTITGGNPAEGYTYTSSTIDGAIFQKTRSNEQDNGEVIITNNILNTMQELDISTNLIVYGGRDRKIIDIQRAYNHFDGSLDHWEFSF